MLPLRSYKEALKMVRPETLEQRPQKRSYKRVKAEHRYPVYDLNSSIEVARAIRDRGGGSVTLAQLASFLDYSGTNNGAFIRRVAAARLFGLVEDSGQFVGLAPLARAILAPERPGEDDRRGRADAFKRVPLYRSLYERYRTGPLPPEAGLRNTLETQYELPRAQTERAYRAFMESADQAGFFEARGGARTNLVMPIIPGGVPPNVEFEEESQEPIPEIRAEPSQPQPQLSAEVDVIKRLRLVLVEKIREVPADNLDTIREYIKEIKELEAQEKEATQTKE